MTPVAAYTWKRHSLFGSANIPSARSPYTISHINTCLTHTHVSPCFLTLSPFWPTAKLYFTIRVDSHLLGICAYLQIPLLLVFLLVLQVFSMLLASMVHIRVYHWLMDIPGKPIGPGAPLRPLLPFSPRSPFWHEHSCWSVIWHISCRRQVRMCLLNLQVCLPKPESLFTRPLCIMS